MSVTTKKKHVTKEVLEEYPLPEGSRQVVKVVASRGNNLHEVVTSRGEKFLVSMPSKFRKHVWIKRGDFILVEPIEEGDKVKAEISHILFKEQIKHIQEQNLWPEEFSERSAAPQKGWIPEDLLPPSEDESEEDGEDRELGDLCINVNRVCIQQWESESEDSCSEDEEEEDEEQEEAEKDENESKTEK
ncbi:probable RNA-binding protein EIF1AD [Aplysia californica]|uniref:Probable RNA-binding protein EIF1AD n=1 Tax=Aplysia californica TaxID=6500 RepID=A0ABM0JEQ0_APLCA|nr:probable RNA-binding protein EIF1AD [Aplysia californica]